VFYPTPRLNRDIHNTEYDTYLSVLVLPSHQQHPEDEDEISLYNGGKHSYLDVAVCPGTFH